MYFDITHKYPKPKKKSRIQYHEHNAHFEYKELYNRLLQLMVEFSSERVGREGVYFQEDKDNTETNTNTNINTKVNAFHKRGKAFSMTNIFNKEPIPFYLVSHRQNKDIKENNLIINKITLKKDLFFASNNIKSRSHRFLGIMNSSTKSLRKKTISQTKVLTFKPEDRKQTLPKQKSNSNLIAFKKYALPRQNSFNKNVFRKENKVLQIKQTPVLVFPCV